MTFCGQCGTQVAGTRFCMGCGSPVAVEGVRPIEPSPIEHSSTPPSSTQPPAPPSAPSRRHGIWWALGGVAALLAIGGGVVFLIQRETSVAVSGAESPEAAVVGLVQAINDKDLIGAATLMPPDELAHLGGALSSAGEALTRTGVVDESAAGGEGFPALLSGLNASVSGLQVRADIVEPGLARVSILGGTLQASIDPATTTGLLRSTLEHATVDWSSSGSFTLDIADVKSHLDVPLFVMAVQRGDGWFVSPTYTAGEYLLNATGAQRASASLGDGQQVVYDTPVAAAEGFVDRLADAVSRDDSGQLADALAPAEAAAVLTYRRGLDLLLSDTPVQADVDGRFDLVREDGDTAIVRPVLIAIDGYDGRNYGRLEIQEDCFSLNGESRGCLTDWRFLGRLHALFAGAQIHPDLVVVRVGEGWRLSLGATAVRAVEQALEDISPTQVRLQIAEFVRAPEDVARVLTDGMSTDRQVGLDQRVILDFADSEVYKVVEMTIGPGQSFVRPETSDRGDCRVSMVVSSTGETIYESDGPGTYRVLVDGLVQESDTGAFSRLSSCTLYIPSR